MPLADTLTTTGWCTTTTTTPSLPASRFLLPLPSPIKNSCRQPVISRHHYDTIEFGLDIIAQKSLIGKRTPPPTPSRLPTIIVSPIHGGVGVVVTMSQRRRTDRSQSPVLSFVSATQQHDRNTVLLYYIVLERYWNCTGTVPCTGTVLELYSKDLPLNDSPSLVGAVSYCNCKTQYGNKRTQNISTYICMIRMMTTFFT